MADLKHCAQMADSMCHHPIEFLYPEYANDRYAIQRDARSIGFFSWVLSQFLFFIFNGPISEGIKIQNHNYSRFLSHLCFFVSLSFGSELWVPHSNWLRTLGYS